MSNSRCPQKGTAPQCGCGCGQPTKWKGSANRWARFVNGHQNTGRPSARRIEQGQAPLCKCGCGETVKTFRYAGKGWTAYVVGHNPHQPHTEEALDKMRRAAQCRSEQTSQANRDRVWSAESRERASDSKKAIAGQIAAKVSGSGNPSWRGGTLNTHKVRMTVNTYQMEQINKRIRARDGDKCVLCTAPRSGCYNLPVHHISDDMSDHSELNLATLCSGCHMRVEFGASEEPRMRLSEYMARFS